jgi:hypothetical protein
MKRILILLVLLGSVSAMVGCEAEGKADKHGVSVDVDKK